MSKPFYADSSWVSKQSPVIDVQPEPAAAVETTPDFCEKCGIEWRPGFFPFCKGSQQDHLRSGRFNLDPLHEYIDVALPGDNREWGLDNAGNPAEGVRISSRDQRNAIMKEHNLVSGGSFKRTKSKPTADFGRRISQAVEQAAAEVKSRYGY